MKSLAFATMVRGDHDMLRKWVGHYRRLVDDSRSLYVVAHGEDPEVARIADGCSLIVVPYDPSGKDFEEARRGLFWGLVRALKGYHEFVVTLDVDEFLVLDPDIGGRLEDRLRAHQFKGVAVSPLGIDVVHKPSTETDPAPLSQPVLGRRRHGLMQGQYSKPCIFRQPHTGGGTQHELRGQPWDIDTGLVLFHLRFYDRAFAQAQNQARVATFEQFQQHGDSHSVGGWQRRFTMMDRMIGMVEAKRAMPLTADLARDFADRQSRAYEARGRKFDWRQAKGEIVHIPDRFVGLV